MPDHAMPQKEHDSAHTIQPVQEATPASPVRGKINYLALMRHGIRALGMLCLAIVASIFFKPEIATRLQALSPFSQKATQATTTDHTPPDTQPHFKLMDTMGETMAADANTPMNEVELEKKRVAEWISKRYRVANSASAMLVSTAYLTAQEINLDPLLILAVMAIESRFNPFAESPVGAQGLMQVMSRVHHDKFAKMGGAQAALDPATNIRVGSLILKEYVARGGSVEAGLKRYVGAAAMTNDFGYGAKVLGEYDRLKAVASGKRISVYASMTSRAPTSTPSTPSGEQPAANEVTPAQTETISTNDSGEEISKKEKLTDNSMTL